VESLGNLILEAAGQVFAFLETVMQWDKQRLRDALEVVRLNLLHWLFSPVQMYLIPAILASIAG
jgi:hypothetical protein